MYFDVINVKKFNDIKWFCKTTWLLYRVFDGVQKVIFNFTAL